MPSSFQFESINLNDVQIGGHFQLLRDGEYLDRQNQIWRNTGVQKSDESTVNVLFLGPDCDPSLTQKILRRAKTEKYAIKFSVNSSGTITLGKVQVQYVIIKPGIELARAIVERKEPKSEPSSRKRIFTSVYVALAICCIAAIMILGIPRIIERLQPTPANETLVFSDDFSDRQISLGKWNPISGSWKIVDEKYYCVTEKDHCLSLATNISTANFTMDMDVLGKDGVDKSIYFGLIDQKYYRVSIRSSPVNQILISEIVPDQQEKILAQTAFDNASQKWYHVRVSVIQQSIAIYVDDMLIFSAKDLEIENANGFLGLGVEPIQNGSSTKNSAEFDNVKLSISK